MKNVEASIISSFRIGVSNTQQVRMMAEIKSLLSLPHDLLHLLSEYLGLHDGTFGLICRRIYLLTVHIRYMRLTKPSSLRYYYDAVFRDRVQSSVSNPGRQLSLSILWHRDIVDVSVLSTVHTLDLSGCRNIIDVSMLGYITM